MATFQRCANAAILTVGALLVVFIHSHSASGADDENRVIDLEEIKTLTGKRYEAIEILGADAYGLMFRHREGIAKVKEARITSRIGATSHHVVRLEADPDDDSLTQVRRWAIAMAAEVGNQTRVSPTARGAVMSIDTPVAAFERQLASCRFGLGGDPLSVTRSDEPDPAACGRLAAEKGVARRSFGGRSWSRTVDVQANQTTIEYVTCDEKTRWTATASVGGHSWSTVIARRLDASLARKVIP